MEHAQPSPLAFKTGYSIAHAGIYALLPPESGEVPLSRPFPLVWRCYDVFSFGERPIGLVPARFQGYAGCVAQTDARGGPPLPSPSFLRFVADDATRARRIITEDDGPPTLIDRLGAAPIADAASRDVLRFLKTSVPGRLEIECDSQALACPGMLCVYLCNHPPPLRCRPIRIKLPAGGVGQVSWPLLETRGADYLFALLLHETVRGDADFLHPLDFGLPGLRYSARQDRIVLADTEKAPHGRQAYPAVYTEKVGQAACRTPAAGPALRPSQSVAGSFTKPVRDLEQRFQDLEQREGPIEVAELEALRLEVLRNLARINAHNFNYRNLELVMQETVTPEVDDADPMPFAKVFKAYSAAAFCSRMQLFEMLVGRLPALHRQALLDALAGAGEGDSPAAETLEALLALEPEDPRIRRLLREISPGGAGDCVLRPTGETWGPLENRDISLAGCGRSSRLVACDAQAGEVFLLEPGKGPPSPVPGNWVEPCDACTDGETVLVLDRATKSVTRLDSQGRVLVVDDAPSPRGWEQAEPVSLRRNGAAGYFAFEERSRATVLFACETEGRTSVLFLCDMVGFVLGGWDVWERRLVVCNANQAAIHLYDLAAGTWETLRLPVDYPQILGCSVAGDFAYLLCPPFVMKYDLRRRRVIYMAPRPQWTTFYPLRRGVLAVSRPQGHFLYLAAENKKVCELLAHEPV